MVSHKLIEKKMFGVYTKNANGTDIPSQIRFGGYNEDLLQAGQELVWINTNTTSSWAVTLQAFDFHYENILETPKKALINPGFPFIAAPLDDYEKYKADLLSGYPQDKGLVCTDYDWCYFTNPCRDVAGYLEPLVFRLGSTEDARYYEL